MLTIRTGIGRMIAWLCGFVGVIAVVFFLSWVIYSPHPTRFTVEAWERNFAEAIIAPYEDFRGHWVDGDVGAYIFSYRCRAGLVREEVFQALGQRLPSFRVRNGPERDVLVLRRFTNDTTFDEWSFSYDPDTERITALYVSIDSAAEAKYYPKIVGIFLMQASQGHVPTFDSAAKPPVL